MARPVLSIAASAPIFYVTGPRVTFAAASLDPRRYYDPAWGREDIFVDGDDLFAWIFA